MVAYIPEILGEKRQNVQCMCVCVCVCVFGELRVLEGGAGLGAVCFIFIVAVSGKIYAFSSGINIWFSF